MRIRGAYFLKFLHIAFASCHFTKIVVKTFQSYRALSSKASCMPYASHSDHNRCHEIEIYRNLKRLPNHGSSVLRDAMRNNSSKILRSRKHFERTAKKFQSHNQKIPIVQLKGVREIMPPTKSFNHAPLPARVKRN